MLSESIVKIPVCPVVELKSAPRDIFLSPVVTPLRVPVPKAIFPAPDVRDERELRPMPMFSFAPSALLSAPEPKAMLSLPDVREEPVISVPIIMLSVEVVLS